MDIPVLPSGMRKPVTGATQTQHLANAALHKTGSDFSSLVSTGEKPAVEASRIADVKLAGMLLGNLMQFILPAEADAMTGQSLSNDYWKSFLADAIAGSIAESGKLDLQISRQ